MIAFVWKCLTLILRISQPSMSTGFESHHNYQPMSEDEKQVCVKRLQFHHLFPAQVSYALKILMIYLSFF
jgi:hypothetical protein